MNQEHLGLDLETLLLQQEQQCRQLTTYALSRLKQKQDILNLIH